MWKVIHYGGQVTMVRGNQSPASAARDAFNLTGISVKSVEDFDNTNPELDIWYDDITGFPEDSEKEEDVEF